MVEKCVDEIARVMRNKRSSSLTGRATAVDQKQSGSSGSGSGSGSGAGSDSGSSSSSSSELGFEDLKEFEYLDAVISEAMRIYPPLQIIRDVEKPNTTVGPYRVDAGCEVMFSALITHMDPKYYAEPEKFRPERFLKSDPEQIKRHK